MDSGADVEQWNDKLRTRSLKSGYLQEITWKTSVVNAAVQLSMPMLPVEHDSKYLLQVARSDFGSTVGKFSTHELGTLSGYVSASKVNKVKGLPWRELLERKVEALNDAPSRTWEPRIASFQWKHSIVKKSPNPEERKYYRPSRRTWVYFSKLLEHQGSTIVKHPVPDVPPPFKMDQDYFVISEKADHCERRNIGYMDIRCCSSDAAFGHDKRKHDTTSKR